MYVFQCDQDVVSIHQQHHRGGVHDGLQHCHREGAAHKRHSCHVPGKVPTTGDMSHNLQLQ